MCQLILFYAAAFCKCGYSCCLVPPPPLMQLCAVGMEHGVFFINTHFRLVCKNELYSFVNTFVSITVCSYGGGYDVYPHWCVLRWAVQLLYEGYSIYTAFPVATLASY